MNDVYVFLSKTQLFAGATADEIEQMIGCLGARKRKYEAGEYIHHMGDTIKTVGLVLEGSVRIENVDVWGNVSVIGESGPGKLFGEAYAAVPGEPLMINVVAAEKCEILLLTLSKVITTCPHACPFHARASSNLTTAIARHNLALSRRLFHMAPKTIRGKVLSYLSDQAERAGSNAFDVPYNRQQLADYLGVDRSALSAELSRMQKDGLLETNRKHFKLHS